MDLDARLTEINPPTTTLGGRVSGDFSGRLDLIPGVEVILLNPDMTNSDIRTTTDSEGRYKLSGIKFVTFRVRYRHPNFQAVVLEYTFNLGDTRLDFDVILAARPK
jgi:hypothetical protein